MAPSGKRKSTNQGSAGKHSKAKRRDHPRPASAPSPVRPVRYQSSSATDSDDNQSSHSNRSAGRFSSSRDKQRRGSSNKSKYSNKNTSSRQSSSNKRYESSRQTNSNRNRSHADDTNAPEPENEAGLNADLAVGRNEYVVPDEVSTNRNRTATTEEFSCLTDKTLNSHMKEVIVAFTKKSVFPKVKFFGRVDQDQAMSFSLDKESLCQYVLVGCNIKTKETTNADLEKSWYAIRKTVNEKITNLRNDKCSAIRKAWFGKFVMDFYFCFMLLTIFF